MIRKVTEMTIRTEIDSTDYIFTVEVITDGSATYIKRFNDALEAVRVYNSIVDHGFARNEVEATLIEPNGKVHRKFFKTPAGVPIR